GCRAPQPPAELVLTGATVQTLDARLPRATAVAVRDGRIVAVGTAEHVAAWIGATTQVVDLAGAFVYPGFADAHMHLAGTGERELSFNLEGIASREEFLARVRERAARTPPGEWLTGRGWIETFWDPPVFPTREELDRVAPDHPVFLVRADGHGAVANSRALAIAGIGRATPDPFGGAILRDTAGEPTGMLLDAAQTLITRHIPPDPALDPVAALRAGLARSVALGWTQVHDAGVEAATVERLRALCAAGELPLRWYGALDAPSADADLLLARGATPSECDGHLTVRALKFYADGALGSRGAALLEPYADAATSGFLTNTPDVLLSHYERALRAGVQVWTHAIGDRANRFVLDLYAQALQRVPEAERAVREPRWRVEHAQVLHPEDILRFAALGVIPSMQPSHAISDLHFAPRRLGLERLAGAYAWHSLLATGATLACGSDAPVERGDPRLEFYAAVARRDLTGFAGEGWHPEQAMTREQALRCLTWAPAWAAFEEQVRGSIAVGKYADFTVLGADLLTVPAARIPTVPVVMTVVGGRIVYTASSGSRGR
ncbi:MAG TPA: amidohydrolase, partial [Gammaproteobacteria bacterium]|nr:amidohydrolase [Gammaproteobacteria bacterium]